MPLRGRVGRHTQDRGRQCQNWADDQKTVIYLLNRIPWFEGGAMGGFGALGDKLDGPIHSGISSEALYRAITKFEDKQFPRQRSGFVDPDGAMLRRMTDLAKHVRLDGVRGESEDDRHRDE
jgi:hypothetical protein